MRLLLCIVVLMIVSYTSFPQGSLTPQLISPKIISPEANSLGKFGDIPVGKFTGVPNITIPIYALKVGDFTLPITLAYHASGIRVEEVAPNAGLGWALNAGGVISRTIYGLDDFSTSGYLNTPYHLPDHSFSGGISYNSGGGPYPGGYDYFFAKKVASGEVDAQPDLYQYNFCNYSGKFYYDYNQQVHPIPLNAMKFQVMDAMTFKITDEEGIIYVFTDVEQVTQGGYCGTGTQASAYLSKILLPDKDSVVFAYDILTYSHNAKGSYSRINLKPGETSVGGFLVSQNLDCLGGPDVTTTSIQSVRLKNITTTRGVSVDFKYTTSRLDLANTKSLDSIIVKYNTDIVRSYSLYHSYFTPNPVSYSDPNQLRLKLDSVKSNVPDEVYRFTYNEQITLPSRLSKAIDHYGYYNGKTANSTLLPINYEYGFNTGANRNIDTAYIQAAILKIVQYPTGGKTNLTYEPNDYHFIGTEKRFIPRDYFLSSGSNQVKTLNFTISDTTNFIRNPLLIYDALPTEEGATCDLTITSTEGFNLSRSNQKNTPNGEFINLTPGHYTITITVSGNFNEGFANIIFQEQNNESVNKNNFTGGVRIKTIKSAVSDDDAFPVIKTYKYIESEGSSYSSGKINFSPEYIGNITYTVTHETKNIDQQVIGYQFTDHQYWKQLDNAIQPLTTIQGSTVGYVRVEELNGTNGENGKTVSTYSYDGDFGGTLSYPMVPTISLDWSNGMPLTEIQYKKSGGNYSPVAKTVNYHSIRPESEFWNYHFNPATYNSNNYLRAWGIDIEFKHLEYIIGLQQFPAEFKWNDYHFISKWVRQDSTVSYTYGGNNDSLASKTILTYGNLYNLQPTTITTTRSDGKSDAAEKKFPHDNIAGLPGEASTAKQNLIDANKINTLLEERKVVNGNEMVKTRNNYKVNSAGESKLKEVQQALLGNSLETRIVVSGYDGKGNVIEQYKTNDVKQSYIWDYISNYPVATCVNADTPSIAYTSFEAENKGHWTYSGSAVTDATAPTGTKCYYLPNGNISKTGLSNTTYIISYWSKSSYFSVNSTSPVRTGKTVDGWTYYEHEITGTSVTISGGNYIDELRLYPKVAQMTTYTYKPLIGMTSQCDANNKITYYQYDAQGRLKAIRDQDKYVVRTFDYQLQKNYNQ